MGPVNNINTGPNWKYGNGTYLPVRWAPPTNTTGPRAAAGFQKFWRASANQHFNWTSWGAGSPLMKTARVAAIGGLGITAFSGARTAINRVQNRDYSGGLAAGMVAGVAGYGAYHYALGGGSIRNHLRLAARAGSSIGNYLKSLSTRVRI